MSRRPHLAMSPSTAGAINQRGQPATPYDMVKIEFGRILQAELHKRHWKQADLVRAVEQKTGHPIGRDAVSTYINGRSYPEPATMERLAAGLEMDVAALAPASALGAMDDEHPEFEMKVAAGHPGKARLVINRIVSFATGAEIVRLLNEEDQREAAAD